MGCVGKPVHFYSYSMGMPTLHQWDFSGGTPDGPYRFLSAGDLFASGHVRCAPDRRKISVVARDTLLKPGYIQVLDTVYQLPYREGFEGATFPPAHTWIDNPDGNRTWGPFFASTSPPRGAFGASPTSIRLLFYNYSRYQEKDSWNLRSAGSEPLYRPEPLGCFALLLGLCVSGI
ncbi:MAG: hypothetical protein KatS3mg026_1346 [Bacteroidia bacterium]|nr:MAG: hypothetical protein KatS3mg026_1346 [Bacteroidia bacterium]